MQAHQPHAGAGADGGRARAAVEQRQLAEHGLRTTGPAPPGAGQEFDAAVDDDKQRLTGVAGADNGLTARVHRIGRGGRQFLQAFTFEPLEQGGAAQCDDPRRCSNKLTDRSCRAGERARTRCPKRSICRFRARSNRPRGGAPICAWRFCNSVRTAVRRTSPSLSSSSLAACTIDSVP